MLKGLGRRMTFPALVGMNRTRRCRRLRRRNVPRTRGDEPLVGIALFVLVETFPALVGMNRLNYHRATAVKNVPRTRGDEPVRLTRTMC